MSVPKRLSPIASSAVAAAAVILFASPSIADVVLPSFVESSSYLGIHTGDTDVALFNVGSDGSGEGSSRSMLGRLNEKPDLPASEPPIPEPTAPAQLVPDAPDAPVAQFDGNFALIDPGAQINFSNTDTYAEPGGGVDCAAAVCESNLGSDTESDFFIPDGGENPDDTQDPAGSGLLGADQGQIASGNGLNENVDFTALSSELILVKDFVASLETMHITATLDLTAEGGEIQNFNITDGTEDFVLSEHLTGSLVDGLNIINIVTKDDGAGDFKITNSNFIVDGGPNSTFVFLVNGEFDGDGLFEQTNANMLVTNSRILAGPDMDPGNIMFIVMRDMMNSDTHFNMSQSEIWGAAFWDLTMNGSLVMNNVRGCGQFVSNQLGGWNDVSLVRCAFDPEVPPVPIPAAIWLMLTALSGMGAFAWRRSKALKAAA